MICVVGYYYILQGVSKRFIKFKSLPLCQSLCTAYSTSSIRYAPCWLRSMLRHSLVKLPIKRGRRLDKLSSRLCMRYHAYPVSLTAQHLGAQPSQSTQRIKTYLYSFPTPIILQAGLQQQNNGMVWDFGGLTSRPGVLAQRLALVRRCRESRARNLSLFPGTGHALAFPKDGCWIYC